MFCQKPTILMIRTWNPKLQSMEVFFYYYNSTYITFWQKPIFIMIRTWNPKLQTVESTKAKSAHRVVPVKRSNRLLGSQFSHPTELQPTFSFLFPSKSKNFL